MLLYACSDYISGSTLGPWIWFKPVFYNGERTKRCYGCVSCVVLCKYRWWGEMLLNVLLYTHTPIRCNNKFIRTDPNHQPKHLYRSSKPLMRQGHPNHTGPPAARYVPPQHIVHAQQQPKEQDQKLKGCIWPQNASDQNLSELHERCHKNSDPWRRCWQDGGLLWAGHRKSTRRHRPRVLH